MKKVDHREKKHPTDDDDESQGNSVGVGQQRRLAGLAQQRSSSSTTTATPTPTTPTSTTTPTSSTPPTVTMTTAPTTPPPPHHHQQQQQPQQDVGNGSSGNTSHTSATQSTTTTTTTSMTDDYDNDELLKGLDFVTADEEDEEEEDDEDLQKALALSLMQEDHDVDVDDDDDEQLQLQQALQLSLQQEQEQDLLGIAERTTTMIPTLPSTKLTCEPTTMMLYSFSTQDALATMEPCRILDLHYILWDTGITTEHDQRRWLSQGIQFKQHFQEQQDTTTTTTLPNNNNNKIDSVMAAIICHYETWGLTQTHGGPCGVLASIQAELLRLLLFGPRNDDGTLEYPTVLTNHFLYKNNHDDQQQLVSTMHNPQFLQQALCMAMSLILARASLTPPANTNDDPNHHHHDQEHEHDHHHHYSSSSSEEPPTATVQLVVPKHYYHSSSSPTTSTANNNNKALAWDQLEPWSSDKMTGSGLSESLVVYTIRLPAPPPMKDNDNNDNNNDGNPKRAKRDLGDHNNPNNGDYPQPQPQPFNQQQQQQQQQQNNNDNDNDDIKRRRRRELWMEDLAHKTTQFLLETNLMDCFHHPGGVLLFVLSLALSRGIPNVQGDMDDPTAKLTTNFGHTSQELLNLLLTGQAVSNVFDHTLRPSGELICRGIQTQPQIGYLSLLESMRYVQVGSYYKQPKFPIWVVGSTSHFTVLFGDAACLKESASDQILENVRRAFKQQDGGEENGFIQTHQLTDFFHCLQKTMSHKTTNTTTTTTTTTTLVNESGIQALAATLEVHGAGIILWEDLWKRVSRLLTGASLESVLEEEEDDDDSNNNHHPNSLAIATTTTPQQQQQQQEQPPPLIPASKPEDHSNNNSNDMYLSDIELARKLQDEWNGITPDPPASTTTTPFQTPPTTPTQHQNKKSGEQQSYGETFQLYHYNGLRGGTLKPFRVTRLSADEAIGASVSLGSNSNASNNNNINHGSSGGDLEDVLRTKWPSCKINWLNSGRPPSID